MSKSTIEKSVPEHAPVLRSCPTPEPLGGLFSALGLEVKTWSHRPVFTVEEGQDIKAHLPGGHTKNLFLKDKKARLVLVSACDTTAIDLKFLSRRLDLDRFSFGSEALLQEVLGVRAGSVTPFAVVNDRSGRVRVVLDQALFAHAAVNFHPLDNGMTTALCPHGLVRFLQTQNHPPEIVDFSR